MAIKRFFTFVPPRFSNQQKRVSPSDTPTKTQINTPPLRPGNHGFCLCFACFPNFLHDMQVNEIHVVLSPHHSLLVDVPNPSGVSDANYRFNKLSHGLFHIRIPHPVISQPLNISNQIDSCLRTGGSSECCFGIRLVHEHGGANCMIGQASLWHTRDINDWASGIALRKSRRCGCSWVMIL